MGDWVREWQERDGFGVPVFERRDDGLVILVNKWYQVTLITPELVRYGVRGGDFGIRRTEDRITLRTSSEEAVYRVIREDELHIGVELVNVTRRPYTEGP